MLCEAAGADDFAHWFSQAPSARLSGPQPSQSPDSAKKQDVNPTFGLFDLVKALLHEAGSLSNTWQAPVPEPPT